MANNRPELPRLDRCRPKHDAIAVAHGYIDRDPEGEGMYVATFEEYKGTNESVPADQTSPPSTAGIGDLSRHHHVTASY